LDTRDATQPRSRLGEILLQNGAITQAQLQHALEEQSRLKLPIGQTLLKLNYVTDEAMRQALGLQLNVPYLDLDNVVIDRSLAKLVDKNFAKRHVLMPVARVGSMLTVAMDDPTETTIVDELAEMTGFTINAVTSSGKAILGAFRRIYEEEAAATENKSAEPAPAESQPAHRPSDRISLSLDWGGDLRFRNSWNSPGIELHSGTQGITSPPQALAYAVMACMAMDVVHAIQKGRHDLRGMTVQFDGRRAHEHPRRFISIHLHFEITGKVEDKVVTRAIELSRTKYCSVWNSLKEDIELRTTHVVRE
jgi:uncharacterized OsmC-like protein